MTFSALVGAMVLARAVSDETLSREILNTVAELLKDSSLRTAVGEGCEMRDIKVRRLAGSAPVSD